MNYIYGSLIDLTATPFNFEAAASDTNVYGFVPVNQTDFDAVTNKLKEGISVMMDTDPSDPSGPKIHYDATDDQKALGILTMANKLSEFDIKGFQEAVADDNFDTDSFSGFFTDLAANNDREIDKAIGNNSVVSDTIANIQTGYNYFINQYIANNDDITDVSVDNELKINLILLNVSFPADVMGGTEMTPFEKSFPINSFNKATLALYL